MSLEGATSRKRASNSAKRGLEVGAQFRPPQYAESGLVDGFEEGLSLRSQSTDESLRADQNLWEFRALEQIPTRRNRVRDFHRTSILIHDDGWRGGRPS